MTTAPPSFAADLRRRTAVAHADAEASPFLAALLGGALGPAAWGAVLAQDLLVYAALEPALAARRDHPVLGPFARLDLARVPALEADLAHVAGPTWRGHPVLTTPTAATAAWVARVTELERTWPAGLVAHHYVRYLGDLSGGQVLRALLGRAHGWDEDGLRRYAFAAVPSPKRFRDAYRALLDAAGWAPGEADRVVAEVEGAYRLARAGFDELGARQGPA